MKTDICMALNALGSSLTRWDQSGMVSEPQAKKLVKEPLMYLLRMFWQARYDKLSAEQVLPFDTLCQEIMDPSMGYKKPLRSVAMPGQDHYALADSVFEAILALYLADNQITIKKPVLEGKEVGIFSRLKSIFLS
jgi:hypothetical protein